MGVSGDEFAMDIGDAMQADLSLSASSEDYLLFTYGRLSAADGIAAGKLVSIGDQRHLDQFEVWFKGL